MEEFFNYLYAFLLTELLELVPVWCFSKNYRFLEYMFFVNLLTNPIANLINRLLILIVPGGHFLFRYILIEGAVVVAESLLMRKYRAVNRAGLLEMSLWRCFLYSFGINVFSFMTGVLLFKIILK